MFALHEQGRSPKVGSVNSYRHLSPSHHQHLILPTDRMSRCSQRCGSAAHQADLRRKRRCGRRCRCHCCRRRRYRWRRRHWSHRQGQQRLQALCLAGCLARLLRACLLAQGLAWLLPALVQGLARPADQRLLREMQALVSAAVQARVQGVAFGSGMERRW